MDMCAAIKDAGYTPIACSLQEVPHYWFEYAIYNHQDAKTHNTLPTSADDEIGQAWAAGLNDIKALYEDAIENVKNATSGEDVFEVLYCYLHRYRYNLPLL